jgi:hypothetical protein
MEFPRLVYADRAAASAGTGVVPRTRDEIAVELDQMVSTASKGCGLVYELFADRFSECVDNFLRDLESPYREIALELATQRGYCTPQDRMEAQRERANDGSCSLTGIDPWCCPCGRHE